MSPREQLLPPHMRVARLAESSAVHRAFRWLHLQEGRVAGWQRELVTIPAPPFGEERRARRFADHMRELGLEDVGLDEEGNAVGFLRKDEGSPVVLLSAHLDTVFPFETDVAVQEEGSVLRAPGIADNGAGLAGLLAVAACMRDGGLQTATNIAFVANVGEEAEGNLRGMRHLFTRSGLADRVVRSIALEGAGNQTVVTRGLGSRRFRVTVRGPGGHAWTDAGVPNPIVALSSAIAQLVATPLPERPRTTLNVGEITGGTSVTSVPQSAQATFDLRSTDAEQILSLEVRLFRAVEDAVQRSNGQGPRALSAEIHCIGDRPAAALPADSRILQAVHAVDRHLRLRTEERLGSTDANIPLALGRDAIAIGAGGTAGGIHTTNEWFDPAGRDLALRRVLLILLDVCDGLL